MATRNIQAFRLRSELVVDASSHHAEYAKAQKEIANYEAAVKKSSKAVADTTKKTAGDATSAWSAFFKGVSKGQEQFSGAKFGEKFGKEFGANAVAGISSTFNLAALGGVIGTAITPGIGTAIGGAIGSGLDAALGKVAGPLLETINKGIELNKVIEDTRVEFTQMTGSAENANKYLKDMLAISKDLGVLPQTVIQTSEELNAMTGSLKTTDLLLKAAADQAASFAGTDFHTVAIGLAQIAEQSVITEKQIKSLMKEAGGGVAEAYKFLAEATHKSEAEIRKLAKAGRIRGAEAAQILALGIERERGGTAGYKTAQTVSGRERQFAVLTQERAAEGTEAATRGLGDFYAKANAILDSPQAKAFTGFINDFSNKLIDFTEGALKTGVSVGAGVAQGLLSFDTASLMQSMTKLGDFVIDGLQTVFEIGSPSQLSAREVGVPLGEGLGVGLVKGLNEFIKGKGGQQIVDTLVDLRNDPRFQQFFDLISKSETGKPRAQSTGRLFGKLGSTDPSQYYSATGGWAGMRTPSPTLHRMVWTHPLGGAQIEPGTAKDFTRATGMNVKMDQAGQDMIMTWLIAKVPGAKEAVQRGDFATAMKLLGGTWESFKTYNKPGTASAARLVAQAQSGGFGVDGKPVDKSNPMPVVVMQDIQGGAALAFGPRPRADAGVEAKINLGQMTQSLDDLPKAFVEVTGAMEALKTKSVEETMATTIQMRATAAMTPVAERSAAEIAALTEEMDAVGEHAIVGAGKLSTLAGTIAQVSGQIGGAIPQQQVSKKRGLFSKILGIAAPFLSFIPGVGPILSTIAGAASGFVGGDIGAGISSIAGGFSAGGAFRGKSGGGGGVDVSSLGEAPAPRQFGGPAYGGRPYLVGERGPELFVPGQDGQVHPGGELAGVLEGLRQEIGRLGSMPADHVVMKGARGLNRAMDSDASLMEGYGRRLRLA